ncbi:hypothetical protein [Acinetobacter rathckeae]|uniref:hypothetical protein n=1 Tax=Acinetobacter rathckeae TaxID=2605272 RepID=UPI0018A30621|nr:hypothetical protein [Acinetobacter rathckeae]MBF7686970.1 hypothetical protein [Acinetobacter rathckeae]
MMKKTIFIGTAIAACLILVACSKKEQHDTQATENQTTNETPVAKNPASEPLQPLTKATAEPTQGLTKDEASSIMAEPAEKPKEKPRHKHHDSESIPEKTATVERTETEYTTTEVRRAVKDDTPKTPEVTTEKVATTEPVKHKKSTTHLSEDDAVAAAIAAAQPALKN